MIDSLKFEYHISRMRVVRQLKESELKFLHKLEDKKGNYGEVLPPFNLLTIFTKLDRKQIFQKMDDTDRTDLYRFFFANITPDPKDFDLEGAGNLHLFVDYVHATDWAVFNNQEIDELLYPKTGGKSSLAGKYY